MYIEHHLSNEEGVQTSIFPRSDQCFQSEKIPIYPKQFPIAHFMCLIEETALLAL